MKEQVINVNGHSLELEPANAKPAVILANAKDCLHWLDTHPEKEYPLHSSRLKRYLGISHTHRTNLCRKDIKEWIAFMELAIRLKITGSCFVEIGSVTFGNKMYAYEKEAIPCILTPLLGLGRETDVPEKGFREPEDGIAICVTCTGTKRPKKYLLNKRDGNGSCFVTYHELLTLHKECVPMMA